MSPTLIGWVWLIMAMVFLAFDNTKYSSMRLMVSLCIANVWFAASFILEKLQ